MKNAQLEILIREHLILQGEKTKQFIFKLKFNLWICVITQDFQSSIVKIFIHFSVTVANVT